MPRHECWSLMNRGYSYRMDEAEEAEHHFSIAQAEGAFWRWVNEPRNMADDSTEMFVFIGAPPNDAEFFPDYRITLGPRGGIRRERL